MRSGMEGYGNECALGYCFGGSYETMIVPIDQGRSRAIRSH